MNVQVSYQAVIQKGGCQAQAQAFIRIPETSAQIRPNVICSEQHSIAILGILSYPELAKSRDPAVK